MKRRTSRLEMAGLFDVILILLLASLLVGHRSGSDDADRAAQAEAELKQARAEAAEAARENQALRADLERLGRAVAESHLKAESSPAAQATLQSFLERHITLVEIRVAGDRVTQYRRYGEPGWKALTPPIKLIQAEGPDARPVYIGDFFARFAERVENTYVQRSASDNVFYVLVPDDAERPTWLAAEGLRREARSRKGLQVFGPLQVPAP